MSLDKNCLSYWLPKLQAAGVPVPKTEIVKTDIYLTSLLDGKPPIGLEAVVSELRAAADRIGPGPWFLRTGQGSGKHQWKDTCFVQRHADWIAHICALVEWSHVVDFFGLAHDVWCVREMLPTKAVTTLPRYGDMPLVAEVRCFVRDGQVLCGHDYWPLQAIVEGMPAGSESFAYQAHLDTILAPHRREEALAIARQVAKAFAGDGAWSVDLLPTERGWFVTDMAEMERSFHMPGCPHGEKRNGDEQLDSNN